MVEDDGLEGAVVVVAPVEAQTMWLILVVGRFYDEALLAEFDFPDDAMFQVHLPHALALVAVFIRPLVVEALIASLYSQVRADFLPECLENLNGHPI